MKNKLNKFTLKIVLFSMPIFAFCAAVYVAFAKFPMHFFDGEYAEYQQQKDYIYNNDDYNRVIITGDSKAKCAYYPALLSDDTYNIALGGVSPIENYYYLKEYLENRQQPTTVFVSFTPDHFMNASQIWTTSIYLHRLSNFELNSIYEISQHYADTFISHDFRKKTLEYKYYSIKKYGKAFIYYFTEDRYKKNVKMYYSLSKDKGQVCFGKADYSDGVNAEANYTNFKPSDIIDHYFHLTIDMCLDYGINVIVDTLPMNKSTYEACCESYLSDYSNYMKKLQEEYPQIIVNTDLYYYENEYFGDSTHFNSKGTEKYSKYIKEKYSGVFGNYSS